MKNAQEMSLLNCLVAAQHLEKCLIGSIMSSQSILQDETKQATIQFFARFKAIIKQYPDEVRFTGEISSLIERKVDVEQFLEIFAKNPHDARRIFSDIQHLVNLFLEALGSDVPTNWDSMKVQFYRRNYVRWKPHLPGSLLHRNEPGKYIKLLSNSRTIVVVGDIRKSQDLMTYAENPEDYSENIVKFMTETRDIVLDNMGIFDKFTGDGFVAYFNEKMCKDNSKEFVECFLKFAHEEQEYAAALFSQWVEGIRKHPSMTTGLSIGADIGKIQFRDESQHFVAVGDSIVWATRMCAEGHAGELIVNNLLYHKLRSIHSLKFIERSAQTKSGENFLARLVEKRRPYPRPKRPHQ